MNIPPTLIDPAFHLSGRSVLKSWHILFRERAKLAMNPQSHAPAGRGTLIPIGGAEDRRGQRRILSRFVELSGGKQARIVVIPAASTIPDELGLIYDTVFDELGADETHVINVWRRADTEDPTILTHLQNATGIFISGGDQVKLVSLVGGTLLGDQILARYQAGAVVAGTSAGAAALSEHMIAFGRGGGVPSFRMVYLAPGLGLIEGIVLDQHFRERDRVGRLMTALTFNPSLVGVGVDEDTALVIHPDDTCEVIGSGSVTVVDARDLAYTDVYKVKQNEPIAMFGMTVHILTDGCGYDLRTHQPRQPIAKESTEGTG